VYISDIAPISPAITTAVGMTLSFRRAFLWLARGGVTPGMLMKLLGGFAYTTERNSWRTHLACSVPWIAKAPGAMPWNA
jgi:hypothetical protein